MSERDELDPQHRIWNRMKEIVDTAKAKVGISPRGGRQLERGQR